MELLQDSDERTIRRRIAAFFTDRDRDDVLVLHLSCHGVKDARGRLHLAARDTDLSLLGATALPAGFVSDQLAETQSRQVVLILDCCYSDVFARGRGVRGSSEVAIADEFGVPLRLEAVKALAELRRGGAAGLRDAASAALIDLQDNDDSDGVRRAAAAAIAGRGPVAEDTAVAERPVPVVPPEPASASSAPSEVPANAEGAKASGLMLVGAGWLLGGAGFAASATIDLTGFPSVWFVLLWSGLAVTVATVYAIPLVGRKVELPAV